MQKHPYVEFENTQVWHIIDKSIQELIKNDDLKSTTASQYIVGYLVKQLAEKGVLKDKALFRQE